MSAAIRSAPAPLAPAGRRTQQFDLTPFRSRVRFVENPGFRTFLLVGLGFTALGAVLGVPIGFAAGDLTWFPIALGAAAFGGAGWVPMLLALAIRPWRYLVSLEIDPESLTLRDSTGKTSKVAWNDPDLSLTILESVAPLPARPEEPRGEEILVMPGRIDGMVSPEARRALLDEACLHGMVFGEESFTREGRSRGSAPIPVVARTAARESFGSLYATQTSPGPISATVPRPALPARFDLHGVAAPTYDPQRPSRANGLRELTVTAQGLDLVDAKGQRFERRWSSPKLRVDMGRRLTSPLDRLDRTAATWSLQVGPGGIHGAVDGIAATTIVRAAEAAGLDAVTVRIPGLEARPTFWIADIHLRPPRAPMEPGREGVAR